MLDVESTSLSAFERDLLQRPSVGGLILFARNYASPSQLKALVSSIRDSNPELLIAVDQEGGRVQRFQDGFLKLPPLHALGEMYGRDPAQARDCSTRCAWAMAAELLHYGIDISFAPVLDLYSPASPVIQERAFAAEVEVVVDLALHYIKGMNNAGMTATGKHYPGHGLVARDSHDELPIDERTADEILSNDYQVFARCIAALAGIMPAHVVYPALDTRSAGFSSLWIQEKLRKELAFDGVVFSDDLSMQAAHAVGSVEQRAELALTAGCDMVLVCNDQEAAVAVADWLEQEWVPGNSRIATMRASPAPEIADLYNEDQWAAACAVVRSLSK